MNADELIKMRRLKEENIELHDDRANLINVLTEMVWQHCTIGKSTVDTDGVPANKHACDLLVEMGFLLSGNGRIYKMLKARKK